MSHETARKRLCQAVLGADLRQPRGAAVVSIPVRTDDISEDVLLAATDAIPRFTPDHVRQVLPLVLHALETQNAELIGSGYFDAFFSHVHAAFRAARPDGEVTDHPRYITDYRPHFTADTLTGMTAFEQGSAYDWAFELLQSGVIDGQLYAREDLTMLCRILGMALGKPVHEVPAFAAG